MDMGLETDDGILVEGSDEFLCDKSGHRIFVIFFADSHVINMVWIMTKYLFVLFFCDWFPWKTVPHFPGPKTQLPTLQHVKRQLYCSADIFVFFLSAADTPYPMKKNTGKTGDKLGTDMPCFSFANCFIHAGLVAYNTEMYFLSHSLKVGLVWKWRRRDESRMMSCLVLLSFVFVYLSYIKFDPRFMSTTHALSLQVLFSLQPQSSEY